jgi:MFS transporter, PAT family, beta-lactamase induction signal transducer AmpG
MSSGSADSAVKRWLGALAVYKDSRILCILFLGFSSGLPLALTGSTLSAWLAKGGVDKTTIGLFALVAIPYAYKFVWSPLVDGLRVPLFTRLLGRRRGWAVASQLALMAAILSLGVMDPAQAPWTVAALAVLVAFLSATQDIVIDAYRVEILDENSQGAGAAAVQLGYRVGMLVSGAGALFIAEFYGWTAAYGAMAALIGVGILTILLNREPRANLPTERPEKGIAGWTKAHVIMPFADVLKRQDWVVILGFIVFYKFGDAVAGVMANPFYIETGFSLAEIAAISKLFGFVATLVGIVAGGIMVARFGIFRALLLCGILQMGSNLMFAIQAIVGHDTTMLAVTIAVENFTGGMGSAAFVAYISSLCSFAFTATQYALFSSLAVVGRTTLSSAGGWLADHVDWVSFFVLSAVAAIPGLLLLLVLMRRNGRAEARPATI